MPPEPGYYARLMRYDAWANAETLDPLSAGDLEEGVGYRNSLGEYWTSTAGDILTHVAMHGGYHRAQIAAALRERGREPVYTDFIHAIRQGLVE